MKTKILWVKVAKMMVIGILSIGIILVSTPTRLYAEEFAINDFIYQSVELLNNNSLWNWQVAVDKVSGLPKVLFGSISDIYKGTPQDIAQNFLYDYPEIFGLEDCFCNYVLKEKIKNSYATYLIYIQTYKEIPIENSYLLISVTNKNRISMVKTEVFNNIHININSQISEQMAYDIALEDIQKDSYVEEPGDIELVILPHKNNFLLVWKVQFNTDRFGGRIEYIISDKGIIINKERIRINLSRQKTIKDNPLSKEKEVIEALNSLRNPHLKTETLNLLREICVYEKHNSKNLVAQAIITADLNISGGENLLHILDILSKNNLLDKKLYYKFKHDIYKKKDDPLIQGKYKIDEKTEYNPINPIYSNHKNPSSLVSKSSVFATQTDTFAILQMQVQDFQNILTLLYQSLASSSMERWGILKTQQEVSLNPSISLTVAKTAKKICDKWDQYIQN